MNLPEWQVLGYRNTLDDFPSVASNSKCTHASVALLFSAFSSAFSLKRPPCNYAKAYYFLKMGVPSVEYEMCFCCAYRMEILSDDNLERSASFQT